MLPGNVRIKSRHTNVSPSGTSCPANVSTDETFSLEKRFARQTYQPALKIRKYRTYLEDARSGTFHVTNY